MVALRAKYDTAAPSKVNDCPYPGTPICQLPVGTRCVIAPIAGNEFSPETCRRLAELGVRDGVEVQIAQRTAGGGRVIIIDTMRYALDKHTCSRLIGQTP